MNNQTFLTRSMRPSNDYVPDVEAENVVRTRDTVADFIKHQNLIETIKTSSHTVYCFEGNGGSSRCGDRRRRIFLRVDRLR